MEKIGRVEIGIKYSLGVLFLTLLTLLISIIKKGLIWESWILSILDAIILITLLKALRE